ncbi:hypothetical protein ACVGWI_13540, partial [Enterobacter hormaechei]
MIDPRHITKNILFVGSIIIYILNRVYLKIVKGGGFLEKSVEKPPGPPRQGAAPTSRSSPFPD